MHWSVSGERPVRHAAHTVRGARQARRVPIGGSFALGRRHARAVLSSAHVHLRDAAAVVVAVATTEEQVAGEVAVGLDRADAVDRLALRRVGDAPHHAWTVTRSCKRYSCVDQVALTLNLVRGVYMHVSTTTDVCISSFH